MTEEEWLAEAWPVWMAYDPICNSYRKRRLFVVACVRRFPKLLVDKTLAKAVTWAENFADGTPNDALRLELYEGTKGSRDSVPKSVAHSLVQQKFGNYILTIDELSSKLAVGPDRKTDLAVIRERECQKELLLDVFGNPFRPITLASSLLSWNDGAIPQIAAAIYEERRFEDISILGDALEDAGCEPALARHCRNERPHVRGCWVIDLLLGKK